MPALEQWPETQQDHRGVTYTVLGTKVYDEVARCIYCASRDELTDEHVMPYGLDGSLRLKKASCEACRKITERFEGDVLRGSLWDARVLLRMRSRRKHRDARTHAPLTVVRDGTRETIDVPLEQHPILVPFPIFPPPGSTRDNDTDGRLKLRSVTAAVFGSDPADILASLGASEIAAQPSKDKPVSFARMLAKIAYGYAFAEGQLDCLREPSCVIPCIRGDTSNLGRYVGTVERPAERYERYRHRVAIQEDHERGELLAEIQLFADRGAPTYGVILGALKGSIRRS